MQGLQYEIRYLQPRFRQLFSCSFLAASRLSGESCRILTVSVFYDESFFTRQTQGHRLRGGNGAFGGKIADPKRLLRKLNLLVNYAAPPFFIPEKKYSKNQFLLILWFYNLHINQNIASFFFFLNKNYVETIEYIYFHCSGDFC